MVPQLAAAAGFLFRESSQKAMAQTITDSSDPAAVASPMGSRVTGNRADAAYAPGRRTSRMAMILCKKEIPDFPQAQK